MHKHLVCVNGMRGCRELPKKLDLYPSNIIVIGGGRWSRVLIDVLCNLVPPDAKVLVYSPRNAAGMEAWIFERGLKDRVCVSTKLPTKLSGATNAAIVANAARDHEKATEWAISRGLPVLVEKPLTLNLAATQRLVDSANCKQVYFAAAHVFSFASYIEVFSRVVASADRIESIRVQWMDPQFESRYGEAKSYDPGLTVYADWLPHILSILGTLASDHDSQCEKLEFLSGGAHLGIELKLGNIPCAIELVRNGKTRKRVIEVATQQKKITLDFSGEPGTIISGSEPICADPDWDVTEKPVSRMLGAFLQAAAGGVRDERLNVEIGLRASRLIEQVSALYSSALLSWLSGKLLMIESDDDNDLRYALSEILHMENPHSLVPTGQLIDYVYRCTKEWSRMPSKSESFDNPIDIVRMIIKQGRLSSFITH